MVNTQTGLGDLIPLPSKKQIKSFIDRNKDQYSIEDSTNLDHIEDCINKNSFTKEHSTSPIKMFFFLHEIIYWV